MTSQVNTIDIARLLSGGWRRDPVFAAYRLAGELLWSMLALHGLLNLFKPSPLRETIILIGVGALVLAALRAVVTKRHERQVRVLIECADRARAAMAQGTRTTPETAP